MTTIAPLRVAVAGLGFGHAVHIPAFLNMADVSVVAILGRRPDSTRVAAEAIGAMPCFTVEEMLDQPVDVVSIALPPVEAASLSAAALERRLPVLAEKPLAPSAVAAFDLARVAQQAKLTNAVDFELAELKCFRTLVEAVGRGQIGVVLDVEIEWRCMSYAQRRRLWSWKSDARRHGGVLTLLGIHLLHMAERMFGPLTLRAAELSATATAGFAPAGEAPAEDTAVLRLEGATGLRISMLLCNADSGPPLHRWVVRGSDGELTMENSESDPVKGFTLRLQRPNQAPVLLIREAETVAGIDSRVAPFGRLADRFVNAVRTGTASSPDFFAAARAQLLIDAAYAFQLAGEV